MAAVSSSLILAVLPAFASTPPRPVTLNPKLAAAGPWLDRFNAWRASVGASTLTENSTWSAGDYSHALYMVKNNLVTHYETVGTPYYTAAGDTAARNSNIYVSSSTATTDVQAIDWWMQAPFHAMGMMDPRLGQTGFGSYRETKSGWQMAAAVDVLRGNPFTGGGFPVVFPGDGSTEPLRSYGGNESPDPLQACSGYTAPTGLPVFIEVGGNVATTVGAGHTFVGNGTPLDHCVIDSNNAALGSSLKSRGGVILIPRQPLQSGYRYVVSLTVNGVPHTWSFTVGALAAPIKTPCTAVSAIASPSSPSNVGTPVTITASALGCPNPRYRFWVQAPGGPWVIKQDYGAASTFAWTATGVAADYRLEVDARDAPESVSYDVVTNFTYQLTGCTAVALTASPGPPQYPTGTISLAAAPTCVGIPSYRFWVRPPGGAWRIAQDYGVASTYGWAVTGLAAGLYGLEVDVRSQGSTESYQGVSNMSYMLAVAPCAGPTLAPNPTAPGATGGAVTFTATSTACANPRYRFWVRAPGGAWQVKQDYSPSATFAWTGATLVGTYGVEVDVRDAAESVSYDTVANLGYAVAGCTAAGLSANPASGAAANASVVLTATATCPGTPTYKFWVRAPGGAWTVVQPFGSANTYTWRPSAAGTYSLEVDVRDQGGADVYEKVSTITFVVR